MHYDSNIKRLNSAHNLLIKHTMYRKAEYELNAFNLVTERIETFLMR